MNIYARVCARARASYRHKYVGFGLVGRGFMAYQPMLII